MNEFFVGFTEAFRKIESFMELSNLLMMKSSLPGIMIKFSFHPQQKALLFSACNHFVEDDNASSHGNGN